MLSTQLPFKCPDICLGPEEHRRRYRNIAAHCVLHGYIDTFNSPTAPTCSQCLREWLALRVAGTHRARQYAATAGPGDGCCCSEHRRAVSDPGYPRAAISQGILCPHHVLWDTLSDASSLHPHCMANSWHMLHKRHHHCKCRCWPGGESALLPLYNSLIIAIFTEHMRSVRAGGG